MTNGSSQGLFVIVAVVIFGIFVVISYLLFRDKLQTGLASIFDDSISDTTDVFLIGNNFVLNPNFNGKTNWNVSNLCGSLTGDACKGIHISSTADNMLTFEKTQFSEFRVGLTQQMDINNYSLNKPFSASVEVFIESYEIDNIGDSNSAFEIDYYVNGNLSRPVIKKVTFDGSKKGEWLTLNLDNMYVPSNKKADGLEFKLALGEGVKAKVKVRNPIITIGDKSKN